jgi:Uma2 family endonuclease
MTQLTVQPEDAMASAALQTRYTPLQYLALERDAKFKHEYYDGYITAMAGGSPEHNRIAFNFARKLGNQLEGRDCEAFTSDTRLCVSSTGLYTYPDVMVVCGEALFQKIEGLETLLNPTMIVEVLSPTTESYDRGAKFAHYPQLPAGRQLGAERVQRDRGHAPASLDRLCGIPSRDLCEGQVRRVVRVNPEP